MVLLGCLCCIAAASLWDKGLIPGVCISLWIIAIGMFMENAINKLANDKK